MFLCLGKMKLLRGVFGDSSRWQKADPGVSD